jgi:uncharacterized membrane protein YqhA
VTDEPAGQMRTPGADPAGHDHTGVPRAQDRFEHMLAVSRLLVLVPVVFLLVDAAGSFIYGTVIFILTVADTVSGAVSQASKIDAILGRFLIVMDTYLVGATLMIAAFGFYELFVIRSSRRGEKYWLPSWLKMRDLEDLKARVVSMLILVAAITFVDVAVETHDERGVFYMGLGIAIVIAALTAFLRFGRQTHAPAITGDSEPADD